jgi:type IV secretion system protein VirB9
MKKIIIITAILYSISSIGYAAMHPRGTPGDRHIKVVQYDPNNVVILNGQYGYQTQITFAPNEIVQNVSLGDSLAWQAVPVQNHLFIKPVAESTTNMTVLTNTNSYNFQLNSSDIKSAPIYKLQFTYNEVGFNQSEHTNSIASFDPEKLNWQYSFTGDRRSAPLQAFDNGQFTYFKFKQNGMSKLPAIFIVDKHRNESLVNYHMQGNYLVVNSIAKQFTLRDGEHVTSVYNDLAIAQK